MHSSGPELVGVELLPHLVHVLYVKDIPVHDHGGPIVESQRPLLYEGTPRSSRAGVSARESGAFAGQQTLIDKALASRISFLLILIIR